MHARAGGDATEVARERIATLAVTLRAFAQAAGAEAAILLLDRGDGGQPFVVECPADGPVVLAEGEHVVELDPSRLAAEPLPLPPVRAYGPFPVEGLRSELAASSRTDAIHSELASPDGGLTQLARAVGQLAAAFPGRSVLTATFPTTDPAVPLHLAARAGDPLVLALGEQQFELPPGWPG
ncbi:hypothetical protein VSS74_14175 [Conexibacter stalactiti]|uniref:Uncharacterized protein n=1 Tax=Conexibacter stalactiti TaxID=1940611 RepID=A0ABU4HQ89_9ACTN|nr:hypothetical protein [Conexibacter stalactiti]MDW5595493.1 hypothetical protein [Conexibacter stalactiti]MEC5036135.1 hypothetical protein [Conexibacter stalactiti]